MSSTVYRATETDKRKVLGSMGLGLNLTGCGECGAETDDTCTCGNGGGQSITPEQGPVVALGASHLRHIQTARDAVSALAEMIGQPGGTCSAEDLKRAALDLERAGCALRRFAAKGL